MKQNCKLIKMDEEKLSRIVGECINKIVAEGKTYRKKDPRDKRFEDMEDTKKYYGTEDYQTKGERKPKHCKKNLDEDAASGGNDFNAVNKWVFWTYNWEPIEQYADIFKGAPAKHFIDKFYKECKGDMNCFYKELDSLNRPILVDYVMNNYKG